MRKRIIVLPDSHSKPFFRKEQNQEGAWNKILIEMAIANRRYDWLAEFIIDQIKTLAADEELDIVDLGDFMDLKSLSKWDIGKGEAELERLELDIAYGRDARRRLMEPVLAYLAKLKAHKLRVPKVRWFVHLGNHENRWSRFRQENPAWVDFEGMPDDLTLAESFGAKVIPFLEHNIINRIWFSHYFYKKDPRFAISGVMPARSLLMFLKVSACSGHTHEWDVFGQTTIASTIRCLYCGCYYEHDERYPGPQGHANIWRGITVLSDCYEGAFNEVKYPLEDIKRKYLRPEQGAYDWADVIAPRPYSEMSQCIRKTG